MTSVFNHYQGVSAEGSLQQGLDDSLRALQLLLRQRAALPTEPSTAFPEPDLDRLVTEPVRSQPGLVASPGQPLQTSARRNDNPDPQRAGLETQVVAQTAAVLAEAYGDQGSYQAQNYRVETIQPRTGPARYSLYDREDHRILSFDRAGTDISIRDDQLSEAHKADFLEAAQTLDQQGLPETPQQASQVLGAMGPASSRAEYRERVTRSAEQRQGRDAFATTVKPTVQQAHRQEQAKTPVTPHDLAEWRMASVTLGRPAMQVTAIEAQGQRAAQLSGAASFSQLYDRDPQAPLSLQLAPEHRARMDQDLAQFRALVQEKGPGFVKDLYQLQSQSKTPVPIQDNAQLGNVAPPGSAAKAAPQRSSGRER